MGGGWTKTKWILNLTQVEVVFQVRVELGNIFNQIYKAIVDWYIGAWSFALQVHWGSGWEEREAGPVFLQEYS